MLYKHLIFETLTMGGAQQNQTSSHFSNEEAISTQSGELNHDNNVDVSNRKFATHMLDMVPEL